MNCLYSILALFISKHKTVLLEFKTPDMYSNVNLFNNVLSVSLISFIIRNSVCNILCEYFLHYLLITG